MILQKRRYKNLKRSNLDQGEYNELDFCLLIPCYNNTEGLIRSLASVEYYSDHFLILIVDDGSAEAIKKEILEANLQKNLPLQILRINQNSGITIALNTGLGWIENNCTCRYIARLDAGDICDPQRFYIQVDKMNSHPEIGLIGSWCLFEERISGTRYSYKTPVSHKAIIKAMHFRNVFIHPAVMFRKSVIDKLGLYPEEYPFAEDYAFFWNIIIHEQSLVLGQFLTICESNEKGISFSNYKKQLKARQRVVFTYGSNVLLKTIGIMRLKLMYILPKGLILFVKRMTR